MDSDTQITCDLDLTGAETGDWDVVVTNDDGQYCTLAAGFSVEYPAPSVTAITPEAGYRNSAVHITDLAGDGFLPGVSIVKLKQGIDERTATGVTWVSRYQITCDFDLTGAPLGVWDVYVENPGGKSDTLAGAFTVYPPMVNSISPNHADSTGSVGVNVGGAGFVAGAEVRLTRAGRTSIDATGEGLVSDKLINCSLDLTGVEPGAWNVVVELPGPITYQLINGFYVGSSSVAAWGMNNNGQADSPRPRLRFRGHSRRLHA